MRNLSDIAVRVTRGCRKGLWLGAVLAVWLTPQAVHAYYYPTPGYTPPRATLPSGIDLMESGLYWLQDMTSSYDPRDPASVVSLMEDQAARFFDFAYMAYLIGGPEYSKLDILQRSHFQNRVRDRLFEGLARKMGMYDTRMPRFRPLLPVATGAHSGRAGGVFYHPGGPLIHLSFHFYRTPRGWLIYDVSSNGVSAVSDLRRRLFAGRFSH